MLAVCVRCHSQLRHHLLRGAGLSCRVADGCLMAMLAPLLELAPWLVQQPPGLRPAQCSRLCEQHRAPTASNFASCGAVLA